MILRVLQAHPLVDQVHKSDHNVIYVKVFVPGYTKELWWNIPPMVIDIQNQYRALPSAVAENAPTQKRMIYFLNSGVRPSLFESSPIAKTPRQVLDQHDSKEHFFGALLISVETGGVDVLCQAKWYKFDALEALEKLRAVPETFVVSPSIGG